MPHTYKNPATRPVNSSRTTQQNIAGHSGHPSAQSSDAVELQISRQYNAKIIARGLSSLDLNDPAQRDADVEIRSWISLSKKVVNESINTIKNFDTADKNIKSSIQEVLLGSKQDRFNPDKIKKMKSIAVALFTKIKEELESGVEERINIVMADHPSVFDKVDAWVYPQDTKKRIFIPTNYINNSIGGVYSALGLIHELSHFNGTRDYWYHAAYPIQDNKPKSISDLLQRSIHVAKNGPEDKEKANHFNEVDMKEFMDSKTKKMLYILNNAASIESMSLILGVNSFRDYLSRRNKK